MQWSQLKNNKDILGYEKTMQQKNNKIIQIIEKLLSKNCVFAIYRPINESEPKIILQRTNHLETIVDISTLETLKTKNSYIIAPFKTSSQNPIIAIQADITKWSEAEQFVSTDLSQKIIQQEIEQEKQNQTTTQTEYSNTYNTFHDTITQKQFTKLVLSRQEVIKKSKQFSTAKAFIDATEKYPHSYIYLFSTPITGIWLGSTPELLLDIDNNRGRTVAIAGTQKLIKDELPLKWTDKDIKEQKYIGDYIKKQLNKLYIHCEESQTYSIKAAKLAHIKTDYSFQLSPNSSISDIIKILHPTPAVCGIPKEESQRHILQNEQHNRAYYSGFIGLWKTNTCSLYVNLRCMKITSSSHILYAGSGIIEESTMQGEWQETQNKMETMKQLIQGTYKN